MVTSLFDKYIHLTLMESRIPGPNDVRIETPKIGRKPNISIKGSLLPAYSVAMPEIRAMNFYTYKDLDQFKYIRIEAGYFGSMGIAFEGDLLIPYLEKPSPDSITVFPMVLGAYSIYSDSILIKEWPAGTMLRTVLEDVTRSMGVLLAYDAEEYALSQKVVSDGKTKDLIVYLTQLLPNLHIQFDSKRLVVYNKTVGRSDRYRVNNISMAVKKGEALTITGPWIPSLRPGDIMEIDPFFYKQSLGSTFLKFSTREFITNVVDFSFGTVSENNMVVYALAKGSRIGLDG